MMNPLLEIAEVSVGQHFYWELGGYQVHGQVLITSWVVLGIIFILSCLYCLWLPSACFWLFRACDWTSFGSVGIVLGLSWANNRRGYY